MKFYINRKPIRKPWGGGAHMVNAFYDILTQLGHKVTQTPIPNGDEDIIFLMGIGSEDNYPGAQQLIEFRARNHFNNNCKLVLRVNENDARKNTKHVDPALISFSPYVNSTAWVSKWQQDYFLAKQWMCADNTVMCNGTNKEQYKNWGNKLNNGKINIVSHHWSNNRLKGFDYYEMIDEFVGKNPDRFTYTYIGRECGTFKNTNVIQPLWGEDLGKELSKYDVYVSATRHDPGPNHIIEALSCELPTYTYNEGGGACEFTGGDHVFSNWNDLEINLNNPEQNKFGLPVLNWESCIKSYVRYFERLLNE